jgi:RimJ/RimL family protein N-acetyltransferase
MSNAKRFGFLPMSEAFAREVAAWSYPPPYDLYGWPDWEQMVRDGYEFADPAIRAVQYRAVVDLSQRPEGEGEKQPVGFVQFFPMANVTRLGMGLRPESCGRGYGPLVAQAAAEEALRLYPGLPVDLEVLAWNERAIKAYRKAGFAAEDDYTRPTPSGPAFFYCMVYDLHS